MSTGPVLGGGGGGSGGGGDRGGEGSAPASPKLGASGSSLTHDVVLTVTATGDGAGGEAEKGVAELAKVLEEMGLRVPRG